MKVGFLFNHYAVHQMPHAISIAFELSLLRPDIEIVIACSSDTELAFARRVQIFFPGHHCTYLRLDAGKFYDVVDRLVSRFVFVRKVGVLRHNREFFSSLDLLVSPEATCLFLKQRRGLENLKIAFTFHGGGDRETSVDKTLSRFDLVLLPGEKYRERYFAEPTAADPPHPVVGYSKFDVTRLLSGERPALFAEPRPTVLYNPHFDRSVSSWPKMGRSVLEFFAGNEDYNLVFAPHALLFRRTLRHQVPAVEKFGRFGNIHVDLSSVDAATMVYSDLADIYLGDVSSQVYEFLTTPRPCLFLNPMGLAWQGDGYFASWHLGEVVDDPKPDLGAALARARDTHAAFLALQETATSHAFSNRSDSTASRRAAAAIVDFLSRR